MVNIYKTGLLKLKFEIIPKNHKCTLWCSDFGFGNWQKIFNFIHGLQNFFAKTGKCVFFCIISNFNFRSPVLHIFTIFSSFSGFCQRILQAMDEVKNPMQLLTSAEHFGNMIKRGIIKHGCS